MTGNVVEIGDLIIARKSQVLFERLKDCRHLHVELDDNGNIVLCLDCGKQVDPYWALRMLTEEWHKAAARQEARSRQLDADKAAHIHLIAARAVEAAWRRRNVVPRCPHCGEGISPEDGLGSSFVSKRIDAARRANRGKQP